MIPDRWEEQISSNNIESINDRLMIMIMIILRRIFLSNKTFDCITFSVI